MYERQQRNIVAIPEHSRYFNATMTIRMTRAINGMNFSHFASNVEGAFFSENTFVFSNIVGSLHCHRQDLIGLLVQRPVDSLRRSDYVEQRSASDGDILLRLMVDTHANAQLHSRHRRTLLVDVCDALFEKTNMR